MKLEKLEEALCRMSDKALIRYVKRLVCVSISGKLGAANEAKEALDMVYVECSRRGKERLYDSVYASVSQHPERCELH
jgi:hypothetical protein